MINLSMTRGTSATRRRKSGAPPSAPPTTAMTTEELLALARASAALEPLVGRYFTRITYLHGTFFYNDRYGPDTERRTRETAEYIDDVQRHR